MQTMNAQRQQAFNREVALGRELLVAGNLEDAFQHLERAHVIGQTFVGAHARVHWMMLKLELRRRRPAAVLGQVIRLVLGIIGSAIGVVPVGNTGGTDISMFKRLPIAPELRDFADETTADGRRT
jgi:hypothetical protein